MRARATAIAAIACIGVIAAACGGPAASAPSIAASTPSTHASGAPISTGTVAGSKASIVGEWIGTLDCDKVVSVLKGAKLDDLVAISVVGAGLVPGIDTPSQLKDPAHPCVGAVEQQQSHFFADDGSFGSKNARAEQIDTGTWKVEDGKVVINDQAFGFSVAGDKLTLTPPPIEASCKTKECRTAAAWALIVAMPGTTWTKGIITP
jgi:hypothetical protein